MKKKEILKTIIRESHTRPMPVYRPRCLSIPMDAGKIISIIGARRSGKTYLMYQLMAQLMPALDRTDILMINFEDERLELNATELDLLLQGYQELYPDKDFSRCVFFFDEIQNVDGWERFVRRMYDSVSKNIVLTGSNAKLLSTDIASALRGRSISYTLYPLSFSEYLNFKQIIPDLYSPSSKASVYNALNVYLRHGGYPELVNQEDDRLRQKILQEYFQVMIFRDLVERYRVTNVAALKFFLKRLFASAANPVSIHRIYNDLKSAGIKAGKSALYDFMEMAENIFLVSTLAKYSPKVSVRELGEKKVYVIDNGLLNAVVFRFSDDIGKAVEQAVFWEFKRREMDVYFTKNGYECDFIINENDQVIGACQVCYDMSDVNTRKREIRALLKACRQFNLKTGTIITWDADDEITVDGILIRMVSLPQFLLSVGVEG